MYFRKQLSLISFAFIPIVSLLDPTWLKFLGCQPYWPLFWLLPWSMIYGSINGFKVGLFLGFILDAISPDSSFSQIPGLALCGIWFGRFNPLNNLLVAHLRYGLICSLGSFFCGTLYFAQILVKNVPEFSFLLYFPGIKNILAQVFVTGLFAPLFCSWLLILFKNDKESKILMNYNRKL